MPSTRPPQTRSRFYVPHASGASVTLSSEEAHHLSRVLRLGPGDEVIVFDGVGHEWLGRVDTVTRSDVTIDLVTAQTPLAEPPVQVTVGVGLLKGTQLDDVIRDATILGAHAIAPCVSAHVAIAHEARQRLADDRWARVAVAAAKQCRRAVVPVIRPVVRFDALIAAATEDMRLVCVEPPRPDSAPLDGPRPSSVLLCVGPEGGWSSEELQLAHRAGAAFLGLGPRTLPASRTPGIALAVLWARWGWV